MKILFVSYHYWPPKFGGELLISIERFEALIQRGHRVMVLTAGYPEYPKHEFLNGIEIFRSPQIHNSKIGRGFRRIFFIFWLICRIIKINFDICHLGGTGGIGPFTTSLGNWLICKISQQKGAKLVWVHSLADTEIDYFSIKGVSGKLRKLYLNQMDAIVSVAPALFDGVKRHYPGISFCIPNGIRDDIFIPISGNVKYGLRFDKNILPDQVVFTFLGSVSERKGFDLLAKVFLELENIFPNWVLWVIGPNSKEENQNIKDSAISKLIKYCENHSKRIHFWGRINDRVLLATLLGISDIFVFPSRKEGMGIAPLEAMSAGIPVIVSKIPGVTDLANIEGKTGLYVKVGDSQSLKIAMEKLGTDKRLRGSMGSAASIRIREGFGWEDHITNWENLYQHLCNELRK